MEMLVYVSCSHLFSFFSGSGVCARTLLILCVCDSMYKMDCDVDTGNSSPCQHSMVFPFAVLFSIHSLSGAARSIDLQMVKCSFDFSPKLKQLFNNFLKVLKLFWSTNQFYSCYMQFRSRISCITIPFIHLYLWGAEIHSLSLSLSLWHTNNRLRGNTSHRQSFVNCNWMHFYHCQSFFFSLPRRCIEDTISLLPFYLLLCAEFLSFTLCVSVKAFFDIDWWWTEREKKWVDGAISQENT